MKRLSLIALTFAAPLAVMAQTTVFSDNFASDTSSSYLNGVSSSGTMTWAAGTGMTLGGAGTGKISDLIGSFSAVTLANTGDYVSFVVNFNSPTLGQTGTLLPGAMLMALANSGGVPFTGGTTEAVSSSSTGGATAGYLAYGGQMQMQASAKTSTKFWAKTGTGNNNLSYNSNVSPKTGNFTMTGTGNGALANFDLYTLTYTIASLNTGATALQVTASIYDNTTSTMIDNITGAASAVPTSTLNTFDIGLYTGSEPSGYNINLTDVSVLTNVVPEPSTFALAGLGMLGLVLARRMRK